MVAGEAAAIHCSLASPAGRLPGRLIDHLRPTRASSARRHAKPPNEPRRRLLNAQTNPPFPNVAAQSLVCRPKHHYRAMPSHWPAGRPARNPNRRLMAPRSTASCPIEATIARRPRCCPAGNSLDHRHCKSARLAGLLASCLPDWPVGQRVGALALPLQLHSLEI